MAANNYCGFTYGGTQYGTTATPGAPYSTPQAGYAVTSATPAAFNTQRGPGYDQAYQAAAANTGAFQSTGPAAGYGYDYGRSMQTYDSSKTYYQQATGYNATHTATKTHYSAPPVRNIPPGTKNNQIQNLVHTNPKEKQNTAPKQGANANAASYSSYDAALYSAATMFVAQQQQHKAGPNASWQQYKKSGQPNVAGHKPRVKSQPRPQQLHYCEVCKISCAGPQTYREHLEGQKHKKREASLKMQASALTTIQNRGNNHHCELCDVTCTGNDAYAAHVRGSKHQKVVKLHQKLGKPIPSDDPKKVTKISFVASGTATEAGEDTEITESETNVNASANTEIQEEANCDDIKPVGVEYIEELKDEEGKILSFNCKLCECKFNDPNAKEMHMKGRRHRLQYKRKVQPDLVVDFKPTPRQRRLAEARAQRALLQADYWTNRRNPIGNEDENMYWEERRRFDDEVDYSNWIQRGVSFQGQRGVFMNRSGPPSHHFFGVALGRRPESTDDRHAIARHAEIYPKEEELQTIQRIVSHTERALKYVSDSFAENKENEKIKKPNPGPISKDSKTSKEDGRDNQMFSFQKETEGGILRVLKGVMRVGLLAKGLLLQGDNLVQLVVLCSEKPTYTLLKSVANELPPKLKEVSTEQIYNVTTDPIDGAVLVSNGSVTVKVSLTSPLLREQDTKIASAIEQSVQKTEDLLPREPCLQALAALRHAKWFQARATGLQSCVMVIRIMRDLCQRIPSWQALDQWAMELLIEKVISSAGFPLSPGDCLRRIMESIASGFLINGPGILDPCEKDPNDALHNLTKQQKEDLTVSAQTFLRLIAFRQIYKVLGMDQLPSPKYQPRPWRLNRKRRRSGENFDNDEKSDEKIKKQDAADFSVLIDVHKI